MKNDMTTIADMVLVLCVVLALKEGWKQYKRAEYAETERDIYKNIIDVACNKQ